MIVPYDPVGITTNYTYFDEAALRQTFGGKGFGLTKLAFNGFPVPRFVIIDAKYTFQQDRIALFRLSKLKLYSVRSSGAVSMPGMMATKLNVPFEGIQAAVQDVWNSYNSPQAVAFREKHNISHDIGTAVIIQEMVFDQIEAFTAMTGDIHCPLTGKIFNPTIEGVVGLGDAMVSGEVTPTVITKDNNVYFGQLWNTLKSIHATFGPSDVELAATRGGYIHVLQQRPIKYPPKVFEPIPGCGDAAVYGVSIGAKSTVIASITTIPEEADSNTALYVKEFTPSIYPHMERAAAILCKDGGELCHAAIIARQEGKPAITTIAYEDVRALTGKWYINGMTGAIHTLVDEATAPIQVVGVEPDLSTPVSERVNFSKLPDIISEHDIAQPIDVNRLLVRYYLAIDAHNKGTLSNEDKYTVVNEVAGFLLHYLLYSALGESRHIFGRSSFENDNVNSFPKKDYLAFPSTIGLWDWMKGKAPGRQVYVGDIQQLDNSTVVHVLKVLYALFSDYVWISGYGGDKWAECVNVALRYASGEIGAVAFCDQTFNLKHNGGPVFGKFSWSNYYSSLQSILNAKQLGGVDSMLKTFKLCCCQNSEGNYIVCKNGAGYYNSSDDEYTTAVNGIGGSPHQTIELTTPFLPEVIWRLARGGAATEKDLEDPDISKYVKETAVIENSLKEAA